MSGAREREGSREWAEEVGEKERKVSEWGKRKVWVSFASEGEGQVKGV